MTAYNFKAKFADDVEAGRKRQTIRKRRKQGNAQPGKMLQLYTGQRTKYCRLLREPICQDVQTITIASETDIMIGLRKLEQFHIENLAKDDGFDCVADFVDFFERHYGLPFEGLLIKW